MRVIFLPVAVALIGQLPVTVKKRLSALAQEFADAFWVCGGNSSAYQTVKRICRLHTQQELQEESRRSPLCYA